MPEPADPSRPALMVFSDDWGRHPSSCQHLIRRLLPRYPAWWVNTIGMRRPTLDRATLARAWEKLRQWVSRSRGPEELPAGLEVLNPRMWPWFSRPRDRRINRKLLLGQLLPVIESCPSDVIAVATVPLAAELTDDLPVARWVYYCVDDFSQWPGLDQAVLLEMEERLARRADVLIAVSTTLQDRFARWGRASALLTHGVDLEHWQSGGENVAEPPPLLKDLQRPLVVYWGVIDRRMDSAFIHHLAEAMDRGTIVLIGPEADPDPALYRPERVCRLPGVPYDELPAIARQAAVLVMPYADLPVTRAIQPLKMKEYLATGKPVVSRRLPSTEPWADALDVAGSPEEFSRAVLLRLAEGLPDSQAAARQRLHQESWTEKARQFEQLALAPGMSGAGAEEAADVG